MLFRVADLPGIMSMIWGHHRNIDQAQPSIASSLEMKFNEASVMQAMALCQPNGDITHFLFVSAPFLLPACHHSAGMFAAYTTDMPTKI